MTTPINPSFQVQPFIQVNAVQTGADLIASLPSSIYPRELTGLNVVGPVGSSVAVYMNSIADINKIDSTARGQTNTASYNPPFLVQPGSQVFVVWPGIVGTAAVTFFLRGVNQ